MAGKRSRRSPRLFEREVKQARISVLHDEKHCQGTEEDVEKMEARLQEWPNLLEYRKDDSEPTPLISAVIGQHELCVQFLLEQGADVHALVTKKCVIETAVTFGILNALVFATLMKLDKNVEIKKRIIKLLLKHGSDTKSVINIDGIILPLFSFLIRSNCIDYVELFLQSGADPNDEIMAQLSNNRTRSFSYLKFAIINERHEIIEILLKYGAKLNVCENLFLFPINIGSNKCLKMLFLNNAIEEMNQHYVECNAAHISTELIIIESACTLECNLKSLSMYHKFGGKLWNFDEEYEEVNGFDDSMACLYEKMVKLRSNPLSLKELSRVAILKTMGRRFPKHSDSLELPATLRTFLKFPDVET